MSSTSHHGPGQKVPAWKRLGLKLKPAAPTEPGAAPAAGSQPNGARNQDLGVNASSATKRKRPDVSAPPTSSPLKKTRFNDKDTVAHTPTLKKQKSVTFTHDTKHPADATTANGVKTPAKKTKQAGEKQPKQSKQQPTADPKPALEYLKTWKESRDSWKFNKNYQTLLIKRAFDPHALPTDHIETFHEYIRDLKGGLRHRLRDTAREIKKQDAAEGKAGFPDGTMDVQAKQAEYDAIIEGILRLGLGAGTKRKRFDEVVFMQQPPEPILAHRVIKRMRAELIAEDLSDSDDEADEGDDGNESETPTVTTQATTVASPTHVEAGLDDRARAAPVGDADVKRVRRRKLRVAADDTSSDESSSESESDSNSDSSDSDSSDSDDSDSDSDDGENGAADEQNDEDDSSDSSDSDSSDSDDESDNDAEAEDDDSDDSSDSDSDSEDEEPAKAPVASQPRTKSQARA